MAKPSEPTGRSLRGEIGAVLSYAQEELWALGREPRRPESVRSHVLAYRIFGQLKVDVLHAAVLAVTARHEELRTVFTETAAGPRAVTIGRPPDPVEFVDLSELDPDAAFARSKEVMSGALDSSFDISARPGFRVITIKLNAKEAFLIVAAHPMLADLHSLGLIVREIGARYASPGGAAAPSPQGQPGHRYADYVRQQRADYAAGAFGQQRFALERALQDMPELLDLPTDRPRLPVPAHRVAMRSRSAPRRIVQELAELGRRECGCDESAVLLSAFAVLAYRYSSQAHFAIGTLGQNRDDPAYSGTVGSFAQLVPLVFSVKDKSSFRDLLGQFRGSLLSVPGKPDAPYPKILDDVKLSRRDHFHPVFQVAMNLVDPGGHPEFGEGLTGEWWSAHQGASGLDLSIDVITHGDSVEFSAQFDAGLYDADTVDRMLGHYIHLLTELNKGIDAEVARVSILPEQEEHLILHEWNATKTSYPDGSVVDFIEAQAAKTPQAVAVEFYDESLTYQELDRRANRIARALIAQQHADSDFVGVYMDRSLDMVVALLSVMKAGLAYVPIDPDYPAERCRYMVADSRTSLVLTQRHHRGTVSAWGVSCFILPELEQRAGEDSSPPRKLSPDSRAYMIYTSGSTGEPKGVINRHGSLFNRLFWMQAQYELGPADRILQKTPFSFDVSVWEFFWPLMFGARIVVAKPGGHTDPEYVRQVISQRQVTVAHFVPSMLAVFLGQRNLRDHCASLRWVICSGEALSGATIEKFYENIPVESCQLQNLYGPTEAAIDVSYWPCPPGYRGSTAPIGKPIANVRLYVLDRHMQPQPVGVPGELCIGGIALAEGYYRRPELTRHAFVDNPAGHKLGARLYRTGDRARYLPDGQIEYLGRMDRQVKLRGFRIELGEIEAQLRKLPSVRDAVVVLHETPRDQLLVAYLVSDQFSAAEAREQLKLQLPDAMIPQLFVRIPAVPTTPNGKLDRDSLPDPTAPPQAAPDRRPSALAAHGVLERQLLGLWRALLPVNDVGITDHFLDLGGHSLLAAQIAIRAKRELGLRVTARDMFSYPTIAMLADALYQGKTGEGSRQLPEIVPRPEEAADPFPLTALQEAYWVGEGDDFQLGGVRAHLHMEIDWPDLDVAAAERAINAMVARHDALRMIVTPGGSQRVIGEAPPFQVHVTDMRSWSRLRVQDELAVVRDDYRRHGPSTDEWPLFSVVVYRLSDSDYRIFLRVSLLLADAHSESALAGEFFENYLGGLGQPGQAGPSYRDHVLAMKVFESSESYREAGKYWRARLPLPSAPELPLVAPLEKVRSARFTRRRFQIGEVEWAALKERAAAEGLTPSGVLCAAYAEVLCTLAKSNRFSLNVLTSRRHQVVRDDSVPMAGNFGSTIPLEVDFRVRAPFGQRATQLQNRLWDDLEHAQFSAIHATRELARGRGWSTQAALPVVFASSVEIDHHWASRVPEGVHEVSSGLQTPQVYLDYQVYEYARQAHRHLGFCR